MNGKEDKEPVKSNKVSTSITLDPQLKETAEDRARKDGRSLSNYIERLILEDNIKK